MSRKYFNWIFILFVTMTSVSLVSCGDDEKGTGEDITVESEGQGQTGKDSEIEKNVNRYVYPMVSYLNYSYQIDITSNLAGLYPSKTIKYGIECGYGSYDWEKYAAASGGNSYSCVSSIFLLGEDEFAAEAVYWSSYIDLLQKQELRGLRDDEQQLYNEIVKILRKSESQAKTKYQGRVFVEVDNKRYYIKTI